ncbi:MULTISPECIES: SET domain-containing protein-lysine N-methyltransferase [unclassified Streptomyces]|uniref:SET domain-containing protein-lysine N-methyltransferase n=1 Tax=unclassified Streptomyces TaxID=2593676 RepID=UPI002E31548D|nr:SET domain-containing protein-lysine N-methyltransferase [Streptomyces sp. NBC_01477]
MLHSALHPGFSGVDGVGVFALRDLPLGTALWWPCPKCPVVPLGGQRETPAPVVHWLTEFGYRRADGSLISPCRGAHLLNHSCDASVLDAGLAVGVAVRDIRRGEEVTCDYRTFRYDDGWSFPCRCAADSCVGTLTSTAGEIPAELSRTWRRRLRPALEAAAVVAQETTVRAGDVNGRPPAPRRIRVR